MPVTTPDVGPTAATAGLLDVQMPPGTVLENTVVAPVQTEEAPDMADGVAFTVTNLVTLHPPTE